MKAKILIISIFFMILSLNAFSQSEEMQGWNGTKWGMTKADIMGLFKEQVIVLEKEEYYGGKSKDTYKLYADIGLNDYKIGSINYNVRFLFDRNTKLLSQVNITKSENNAVSVVTMADYDVLEKQLFEKYGAWGYKKQDITPDVTSARGKILSEGTTSLRTAWYLKDTTIELTYLKMYYNMPVIMTLSYKPTSKPSNKL